MKQKTKNNKYNLKLLIRLSVLLEEVIAGNNLYKQEKNRHILHFLYQHSKITKILLYGSLSKALQKFEYIKINCNNNKTKNYLFWFNSRFWGKIEASN